MELGTVLHRELGEAPLPPEVFVRVRPEPRRPKYDYRVRIREPKDVEVARKRGLGMFLLTGEVPTKFHYPMHFGPTVVMDQKLVPVVDTTMRTIAFHDAIALANPPFEALVTMMLKVDEIAARVMLVRNPGFDQTALTVLIAGDRQLCRLATAVRLQEFAPGIPVVGPMLPIRAVHAQDQKNLG
jgi:hypothetical protein